MRAETEDDRDFWVTTLQQAKAAIDSTTRAPRAPSGMSASFEVGEQPAARAQDPEFDAALKQVVDALWAAGTTEAGPKGAAAGTRAARLARRSACLCSVLLPLGCRLPPLLLPLLARGARRPTRLMQPWPPSSSREQELVQFVETTMVREHERVHTLARRERSRAQELMRDVKTLADEKRT